MTLVEVLVIITVIVLLAALVLGWVVKTRGASLSACCNCNLKQVGLACRIFSNDHGDEFPWRAAGGTNGGTIEFAESPQVFRHFLAMSNELSTPRILACPTDSQRQRTTRWGTFSNVNISYFVNVNSDETNPQMFLSGDRNVSGGALSNGFMLTLASTSGVTWAKSMHVSFGNIGMADGSAARFNAATLQTHVSSMGTNVMRLALP
jgi:hypothetical protein